jgi:CRP-like cAMP-binding protein
MEAMDAAYQSLRAYLADIGTDKAEIDQIIALFRVCPFRKHDYFSLIGNIGVRLGFVTQRVFAMSTIGEDGTIFVKDFMTNGQFLLVAFEPDDPVLVNIEALTEAVILEARYSEVRSLFRMHPDLVRASKRGAEQRLESLYGRLESFAVMEAKERYKLFRKTFGDIEHQIPQYLIASYLGVTPTQLSRIRQQAAHKP